ncbi:MAG: hypothetical protein HY319_22770 [Armatimonadetes bacterium]|nr:hypothetical protein [Armatimonadota bacterium]
MNIRTNLATPRPLDRPVPQAANQDKSRIDTYSVGVDYGQQATTTMSTPKTFAFQKVTLVGDGKVDEEIPQKLRREFPADQLVTSLFEKIPQFVETHDPKVLGPTFQYDEREEMDGSKTYGAYSGILYSESSPSESCEQFLHVTPPRDGEGNGTVYLSTSFGHKDEKEVHGMDVDHSISASWDRWTNQPVRSRIHEELCFG